MFCKNCGNELNPDVLFCQKCGARVAEVAFETQSGNTNQTSKNEPVVNSDAENNNTNTFETQGSANYGATQNGQNYGENYGANYCAGQNSMAQEDANSQLSAFGEVAHVGDALPVSKPKRKLKKILLTVCLPIILILAIAVSVYANPEWRNSFLRMVMSDKAYFKYVMGSNLEDYISDISSDFKMLQNVIDGKNSVNAKVQAELGTEAKNLISNYYGTGASVILTGIESAGISIDAGRNENKYGFDLGLVLNDSELVGAKTVLSDDGLYVSVPYLNKTSAFFPADNSVDFSMFFESLDKLSQVFPDEKVITRLIKRYTLCMVNNVSDISEKDITINAGGVKQEAIGMTVKLDGDGAIKIAQECLVEAKKDKDIKGIIENSCKTQMVSKDFDDVYGEFLNGIDKLIEEVENAKTNSQLKDLELSVRFIANSRGKLIGFDAELDGVQFKFYNTENGSKSGTLVLVSANEVELSYESACTAKGNSYNGEGAIKLRDTAIVDVKLENIDKAKYDKGIFNGKITLTPGDGIKTFLALANTKSGDVASIMSYLKDIKLEIESFAEKDYSGNLTITALYGGVKFAALKLEYGIGEQKNCDVPKSYTTITDESDLDGWLDECMKNISNLENLPFALRMLTLGN